MTILSGLGCAALVLLAVTVLWKEIVTHYHLLRLRSEPDYLLGILSKSEGTSERSAIRKFLDGPEGRAALVRYLLKHVEEHEWRSMAASRKTHTFVLDPQPIHSIRFSPDTAILCEDRNFFEDSSRVYEVGRMPPTLNDMMGYLVGRSVSLPEYPGMTFLCHDLVSWQQYLRSRRE
ncbi:MAG TPA: hypothetical protein VFP10_02540 [Candidatus Eisenbacteria bacterium]|nr:hypothetical protein [Candidatus Eisenbacteria bacterium]